MYLEQMLQFLARALEGTLHVDFYLSWCREVLTDHGSFIKDHMGSLSVALTALQKAVAVKHKELGKMLVTLLRVGGEGLCFRYCQHVQF